MRPLPVHQSRAVVALVLLHDEHMRRFLPVWERARALSLELPATTDPSYASLETLGRHVLGAAAAYLIWICKVLDLPDPGVRPAPAPTDLPATAPDYMAHVLDCWRTGLVDVRDDQLETPEYESAWGTRYSIDAMLEHAVMHPIRHVFQLEALMARQAHNRQ